MRLDDKITYLQASRSTDTYGEETVSYTEGGTFWAAADVSQPTEDREGTQPEEQAQVTLTVRTEAVGEFDLSRKDRLKWRGDALRVDGVRSADRNGFDDVYCSRVR